MDRLLRMQLGDLVLNIITLQHKVEEQAAEIATLKAAAPPEKPKRK